MTSKKRTRQNLPKAERQQQLLNCAISVAARNGLVRTVHADVAREAGVAVPTVFLYFRNRRVLILSIIEAVDRYYMALGQRYHKGDLEPIESVRQHLIGFANSVDEDPEYARIWLEWGALTRNEDGLWDAFLDFQERIIRMLAGSIRKAQKNGSVAQQISAANAARLIVASSYPVAQLKFMRRGPRMVRQYLDQALHLALNSNDT